MGSFNTCKSTSLNNLIDYQLCPEDSLPKTSSFFYLKYGEKFSARTSGSGKSLYFPTKGQFLSFINSKISVKFDQVEIALNHPLLKKITLVDTPGIDSTSSNTTELEKLALQADKIIYLFHQRGIDELNKHFLTTLAKKRKIEYRDISFWINCNLGKSDGTSLSNTEQVLRSIFRHSPEIYLINSRVPESVSTVRHYLEIMVSKDMVRKLNAKHKKIDEKIPARIHKSLLIQDDMLFLDNFWDIKDQARKIMLARNILNNLPGVEGQVKDLLAENHNIHILPGSINYAQDPNRRKYVDIPGIKEKMSQLASKMMHDTRVKQIISPRKIGHWAGVLQREEFKVVAVGGFSSGKSTLFNAIMGENLLPAENRPTTSSITYLKHGTRRMATITFKPRLSLKICVYQGLNIIINQEEMQALEEWLNHDSSLRRILETRSDTGKGFVEVTKEKLLEEIQRTKKLFTSGFRSGTLDNREAGTLFRPIPAWKAKAMSPVWAVDLEFGPMPSLELNLETNAGRNEYKSVTTSREALRLRDITIFHPALFFQLATFVDTPGLDSTNQHHSTMTTDFLQHSDTYLFFLNGKHILTKHDSLSLLDMFKLRLKDYLHTGESVAAQYEMAKFFFVINFADTLTPNEREKARNFLRKSIMQTMKENGINVSNIKIFLISPLKALQGKDNGSFQKLLDQIHLAVWNYRGRDYLKSHLRNLRTILESATTPQPVIKKGKTNPFPVKFSGCGTLTQAVSEMKDEIHSRFNIILGQTERLKQLKHFKTFAWGTPEQQGQVVTQISSISYFRWINALNRKTQIICSTWQKAIYKTIEACLHQAGISTNPYALPPSPPGLVAAAVMEQMEATITESRNFYGGFKAKEARQRISILLNEQEKKLGKECNRWQREMEVYLRDLIAPGIRSAAEKHSQASQETYGRELSKEESKVLNDYLTDIYNIEKILNIPGGV